MKRFLKSIFSLALLSSSLGSSPPALAAASWEDEKEEWERLSSTRLYKDPGYAAKLSLNFLPVDNGHFYVGEVGKGVWFSVGETVSLVAIATTYLGAQSRAKEDLKPLWTDAMVVTAAAGGLFYVGLKVLSAFSAAAAARAYNTEQEKRFQNKEGFFWQARPDGLALTRLWGGTAKSGN